MNLTSREMIRLRSLFLQSVRSFFLELDYIEVDTPALKRVGGMEPYLDPFVVQAPNGLERGFLITSPEYSLKQSLSIGLERVFEIAHTFRSGERGSSFHTAEFLMLEFYQSGIGIDEAMSITEALIVKVANDLKFSISSSPFPRKDISKLFMEYAGIQWDRISLERKISEAKLSSIPVEDLSYEDCFYLIFLNMLEPQFASEFQFIYDYPPEMAALSKVVDGKAKRFELYFKNIELANAFHELQDAAEQKTRFSKEQELRANLGKEVFPMNEEFLQALERGIPNCSGVSIGLDRLFMVLLGLDSLSKVSPYWNQI